MILLIMVLRKMLYSKKILSTTKVTKASIFKVHQHII